MLFHIVKKGVHTSFTGRQVLVPVTQEEFVNASALGVSHFYYRRMRASGIDMLLRFRKGAEVTARLKVPKLN